MMRRGGLRGILRKVIVWFAVLILLSTFVFYPTDALIAKEGEGYSRSLKDSNIAWSREDAYKNVFQYSWGNYVNTKDNL